MWLSSWTNRCHERCHVVAQHLIAFEAPGLEDLEPDFKIRVANENGLILLVAVPRAVQEPALVRVRVFWIKPRIRLAIRYRARRSLIRVPSTSPKMIRGSPCGSRTTCCRPLPGRARNKVHCDDGLMGFSSRHPTSAEGVRVGREGESRAPAPASC